MPEFPEPIVRLTEALRKLPGVGEKTALRLAMHLLDAPRPEAEALAQAILDVRARLHACSVCFNVTDVDPCRFCTAPGRLDELLCVVEEPRDLMVIERTGGFRGRYHVLGGALSPIHGVGPDALHVAPLLERLRPGGVEEVILATNPNVEGEATATYVARLVRPMVKRVSRLAMGLPVGGDLEYVDAVTMGRALDGRREI
jgi:recombination protein RecR